MLYNRRVTLLGFRRPGVSLINDKAVVFKDGHFRTFCKTVDDVHDVPFKTQNLTSTMANHRHQYHHMSSVRFIKDQLKPVHYLI